MAEVDKAPSSWPSAIDLGEHTDGVRCLAAPVRLGGQIIAAISITGSTYTMTMERINKYLKRFGDENRARDFF